MAEEITSPTVDVVIAAPAPAPGPEVEAPVTEEVNPVEEIDADASEETEQAGTVPSKAEKRIKQLNAQRKSEQEERIKAQQEAAYYRGLAEARGSLSKQETPQAAQPSAVPTVPVMPVIDNFATFEEYEQAKDEYLIQAAQYRFEQKNQQAAQQQAEFALRQTFQERINKAAEIDPAVAAAANDPTLPVSTVMAQLIRQSELAPELVKFLGSNRQEAQRIAALPPVLAAREMGMIEYQLKIAPKPEVPRKVSAAPEPIKPVTAAGAIIDEDNLPMDQWIKRRNEMEFKRRSK